MVCTFSSSCLDEVTKFPQSSPGIAGINLIETAYPGVLAPGHKLAHLRRRSLVETMSPLDWTVGWTVVHFLDGYGRTQLTVDSATLGWWSWVL